MLRSVWLASGWLWIVTVCYLSLMPHPPQPVSFPGADKIEHACAYVSLMWWFCQLYAARPARIRLALAFFAMGAGIEVLQGMSSYRYFEYADMLANTGGVLIGWGAARFRTGHLTLLLEKNDKH